MFGRLRDQCGSFWKSREGRKCTAAHAQGTAVRSRWKVAARDPTGRSIHLYPSARTRRSRRAVMPMQASARIGRAPSLRFGPNFSRCSVNTSFTKSFVPIATPSLLWTRNPVGLEFFEENLDRGRGGQLGNKAFDRGRHFFGVLLRFSQFFAHGGGFDLRESRFQVGLAL